MSKYFAVLFLFVLHQVGFAQEYARVLNRTTTYSVHADGTAQITDRTRIQINSEKGHKFSVYQEYFDKFQKIEDVTLEITDVNGKVVKRLRKSDGIEFGFKSANEISDAKVLIIDPDYKQYPFNIEIYSVIRLNGFISLPSWVPRSAFHLAVSQSTLIISRPATVVLKFRTDQVEGVSATDGGNILTTYKVAALPHQDEKMRYQDFYNEQPKVLTSPTVFKLDNAYGSTASWKDFGNWFLKLNSEPFMLSKKTKSFIDSLDKRDAKKTIRDIYNYLQDRTRYVSIQLGIGGFKSLPTEDVEKYSYGDCKALTTYAKNMLTYAGISSNYILVRAGRNEPDVYADFPSNQFNHVFLGIPVAGDTVMLECTSQISPANYTGTFTDDRNVLWIDQDKSRIIRSRTYTHEDNIQENNVIMSLDQLGNASVLFKSINKGIFFDEVMLFKSAPTDYVKNYNQEKFPYSDFSIRDFSHRHTDRNNPEFESLYKLQINGLGKLIGERLVIPLLPSTPFSDYIDSDNLMKFYSIKRGMTILDDIEIDLPQNYWIYNLPEGQYLDSRFGSYSISSEFEGNKLKLKRKIIFYKGDYYKSGYDEFKSFYEQLEKIENRKLVLNPKT